MLSGAENELIGNVHARIASTAFKIEEKESEKKTNKSMTFSHSHV